MSSIAHPGWSINHFKTAPHEEGLFTSTITPLRFSRPQGIIYLLRLCTRRFFAINRAVGVGCNRLLGGLVCRLLTVQIAQQYKTTIFKITLDYGYPPTAFYLTFHVALLTPYG